ncbi:universal stress protein [Pseudomonas indica]|uniref:Nucleotide-binding universal stress protein, UspA family n=1 Tax=Pseudomonas indica TaxID=137658 RepID=A0A1G9GWN1_9PSED|nr:universal stress protein [Pseudomonas indica]MBU3056775.1 universal stress protein [Pseudomonas indica]PAU60171.1 universal stress protein UspA [Pseudomonas indica]SDL04992.1 Nucleotide-binding universal stress protein, UspA family [Pseudomonas indica]
MKIMLAYDNSRNARLALENTLDLFGPLKPLVILVGVVEEPRDASDANQENYERARAEFQQFLREAAVRVGHRGYDAEVVLAEGDARKMLLKAAETKKPDMLVIARHSHEPDGGLLTRSLNLFVDELDYMTFGSVSAFLARRAPCPVLIQACP